MFDNEDDSVYRRYGNCRFNIDCYDLEDYNEDCVLFHKYCKDVDEKECYYKQLQIEIDNNNYLRNNNKKAIQIAECAKALIKLGKIEQNAKANYNYYQFKDKKVANDWKIIIDIIEANEENKKEYENN